MAIKDDPDFEAKLAQLQRLYRAMRLIWGKTNAADPAAVNNWVQTGGAVMEKITDVLADLEDYTGCNELRLIWDELRTMRQQREAKHGRA